MAQWSKLKKWNCNSVCLCTFRTCQLQAGCLCAASIGFCRTHTRPSGFSAWHPSALTSGVSPQVGTSHIAWLSHKKPMLVCVFCFKLPCSQLPEWSLLCIFTCSAPGLSHPGCVLNSLATPWPASFTTGHCFLPATCSEKAVVLQYKRQSRISGEREVDGNACFQRKSFQAQNQGTCGIILFCVSYQGNWRDHRAFRSILRLRLDQALCKGSCRKLFAKMFLEAVAQSSHGKAQLAVVLGN